MQLSYSDKRGYSSAILVPGWAKGIYKCSSSVQSYLRSYAVTWEQNPKPAVLNPTVPEGVPPDTYIWPEFQPAKSTTPAMKAIQAPNRAPVPPAAGETPLAGKPTKRRRLDIPAKSDSKGEGVDTEMQEAPDVEMQDLNEAFAYDWFGDSCHGCHHYLDSHHWKSFLEI